MDYYFLSVTFRRQRNGLELLCAEVLKKQHFRRPLLLNHELLCIFVVHGISNCHVLLEKGQV